MNFDRGAFIGGRKLRECLKVPFERVLTDIGDPWDFSRLHGSVTAAPRGGVDFGIIFVAIGRSRAIGRGRMYGTVAGRMDDNGVVGDGKHMPVSKRVKIDSLH